jgi:protein SCO1/2
MNKAASVPTRTARRWLWVVVAIAALGLGVALALRHAPASDQNVATQVPQGGHFTLTDQNGHTVRDTDFAGKYRLIYFGYTYCPDVCPVDVQTIAQALSLFAKKDAARAARVQPFFISVDPARDTPPVLKQFVSAFSPNLIGLTGSQTAIDQAIHTFGIKGYGSYAKKEQTSAGGGYLMSHTRYKLLYGPDGQGIAFLAEDGNAQQIADALDQWVK